MDFTLVVPCYNEAGRWSSDYWSLMTSIDGVHWIFVDDGSSDDTSTVLARYENTSSTSVIRLSGNRGKAEAVRAGLLDALTNWSPTAGLGFIDSDGAFDLVDVERFLDILRSWGNRSAQPDALWSSRVALAGRNIGRTLNRHYIGRIVSTIVSLGEPSLPYDTQSGFKLFTPSPTLESCLSTPFRTRWFFELELLTRWCIRTGEPMRIWEEPLSAWHEVGGSRLRFRTALSVLRELAVIKGLQLQARRRVRVRRGS